MSEKLASAEIDESRERFEKAFDAKYYTRDPLAKRAMADMWEQAERDTRERCAQQVKRWASDLFTQSERSSFGTDELVERIRGVNR